MKKILFIMLAAMSVASCEDFLDTENFVQKNTGNFPASAKDLDQMLTSTYVPMHFFVGEGGENRPDASIFFTAEMASDDRFGGGGSGDKTFQMADKLQNFGTDAFNPFWRACYKGIYRANMLLARVDNVNDFESETVKSDMKGQGHFLRSFYYFNLMQMFGSVPMPLTEEPANLEKSSAEVVYAQIASDMKQAITLMSNKKYDPSTAGRANKYVAEAYMARIFLFYTGYYKK